MTIRQVQPAGWGTFRMPGLVLRVDGRDVPVEVTGQETAVTIEDVRAAPKGVEVDPAGWWLLEATVAEGR